MSSPPPPPTTTANLFSTVPTLRSYGCYNCNRSFLITRVSTDAISSPPPTSFRCPFCFQLHLIPFHTVLPPPTPRPLPQLLYDDDDDDDDEYDNNYISHNSISNFLNSLPVKEFNTNTNKSMCSICMDDFGTRIVVALPCGHCFDKDCIREWLKRSKTCPMCRAKLHFGRGYNNNRLGFTREVDEYNSMLRILREPPVVLRRMNAAVSSLRTVANAVARGADRRVSRANVQAQRLLIMNGGGESSRSAGATNDEDGDTMMDDAA